MHARSNGLKGRGLLAAAAVALVVGVPALLWASVTLVTPSNYTLLPNPAVGNQYYVDRTFTIASQPAGFETYTLILTANNDKNVTSANHLTFTLSTSSTVYVAYDRRATSLPSWMSGFTGTGGRVYSSGDSSMSYFNLYSKNYGAGSVTLGGNEGSSHGAGSNYIVYVQELGPPPPLAVNPAALTLAPSQTGLAVVTGGTPPYHVSTGNPAVAQADILVDQVVVTGVTDGSATITVTHGASGSVTIAVTVATALSVTPNSLNLTIGDLGTAAVSGGTAPYAVSSTSPPVAAAVMSTADEVTVTAAAQGTAVVTVTDAASGSVTISVYVGPPLTAHPNTMDLNVGETADITVAGGTGAYMAASGNPSIATVSLAGSTVTVTAVSPGSITVNITDSAMNVVSVSVNVGGLAGGGLGDCPTPPFITASGAEPNILLILDHSGSMGSGAGSKWEIAKAVLKDIIDSFPNVRFGLMRMDGSDYSGNDWWGSDPSKKIRQGGKVLCPCGTPGAEIKTYITNWGPLPNVPQTWTNLAEALADGGRYFATVLEGANRVGKGPAGFGFYEKNYHYAGCGGNCDATVTDDKGNIINTTSPILFYCQKSFIIFITDGLANYDNDWSVITDVIGDFDGDGDSGDCKYGAPGCSGQGKYFNDVGKYLFEHDMRTDLPGNQNLPVYVVGFQVNDPLLSSTAQQGGGEYYTANDSAGLKAALESAISDILASISSGTAVSTISTSSESDDFLIRAKFLPGSWKGFLEAFTLPYTEGKTPYWEAGQILSQMLPSNRTIYTHMSSEVVNKQEFVSTNAALITHLATEWEEDASETADLIEYLRGSGAYEGTKYRNRDGWPLGDIIHSTPVSIGPPKFFYTEAGYQAFKANLADRTRMVYVGANDGMLHAFFASNGTEAWAFIPENLQGKLKTLSVSNCHNYFVDLTPLAVDIHDASGWKTVLVCGTRLGGEEYFCLDVTDPAPSAFSVIWDLVPFSGRKSSNIPMVGKVKGGGVDKWVAVVTSGYHEGVGAGQIAALNFTTGAKESIWYNGAVTVSELTTQAKAAGGSYYSLGSAVGVDSDGDGYMDLIYVGDTEGCLWKFYYDYVDQVWKKVELFQTGGQPITAKPIAVFDETGTLRVFFGTGKYLIGSDKADSTQSAFYCLIEKPVETLDDNNDHYTSTTPLSKADDLVSLTSTKTIQQFEALSADQKEKINNKGWYFNLAVPMSPAERVIEPAVAVAGVVFFTTFTPNEDVCGFGGNSKLYAIDYKTNLPAEKDGQSVLEDLTPGEKYKVLGPGLPSKPVYYFDKKTKESTLIIQTSDTTVHNEAINVEQRPMAITSWRAD